MSSFDDSAVAPVVAVCCLFAVLTGAWYIILLGIGMLVAAKATLAMMGLDD